MTPDPSTLSAVCPACGDRLWKQRRGDWTLGNRLLKLVGSTLVALCPNPSCRAEVPLPWLHLAAQDAASRPVPATNRARRLVVRVDGARGP